MAEKIRIYNAAGEEHTGTVLGISIQAARAIGNTGLPEWLAKHDYNLTPLNGPAQLLRVMTGTALYKSGEAEVETASAIPEETLSGAHYLIRPPLTEEDVRGLGHVCRTFGPPITPGMLIDNRTQGVVAEKQSGKPIIIAEW